ncbi:MAG: cell division protein ZipA C-terminal FtsZ-binding domain-containing protein [Steroidobacteraceae bacterium]
MAELRFILLIAGLVFLVVLAAWELRKPRQAAPGNATLRRSSRSEPEFGSYTDSASEPAGEPAAPAVRMRQAMMPPRIDLPEPGIGLPEMEAIRAESILANGDALQGFDIGPMTANGDPAPLPSLAAADSPAEQAAPVGHGSVAAAHTTAGAASTVAPVPPAAPAAASPAAPAPQLIVEWPPDGERHIVALRLVPASNDRLSGRAVRLAITGCGFVHGPLGIYHQPDHSGRALVSAASLSKPGLLDPQTLDFQRLAGLNLFTVLPGPLSPAAALDHLLETARELSQRLPARLQTEQGQPLDADRLEDLRDRMQSLSFAGLRAEPAA